MRVRVGSLALTLVFASLAAALGQGVATSAKVDALALSLEPPERFLIPSLLEPVRRVSLVATADGLVRSQDAKAGATVREGQEVAQFDRTEAAARLEIAQAEAKEEQASLDDLKARAVLATDSSMIRAKARMDAALARVRLAQVALDRCTLRAPFSGRLLASLVSDGQFVEKGTVIAELADVSSLRTLVPLARAGLEIGASVNLTVEGQPVSGKVQALLPLPDSLAVLRALATPLTAAWVVVPNAAGTLEPGLRVLSSALPIAPLATIPASAIHEPEEKDGPPCIHVIRNEYVTSVKVRVLGQTGPERVQISGPLRPTDALIVSSSAPLQVGMLIRFLGSATGRLEGTSPNPAESGELAEIRPPRAGGRAAPIGAAGSAVPKSKAAGRPASSPPATKPATGAGSTPF
jgi:RND family efflux transporter MFP subunit